MEIDMTREPESGLLIGTNLWEVRGAKIERSQKSGENMLVLKLKCGEHDLTDRAMLGGGGWGIGKNKLLALGMAPDFKGSLDALDFIGKKVWIATVEGSFEGIDKKTGAKRTYKKMEVDIDQLERNGYQAADRVPAGAVAPAAGNGPAEDPFDVF